MNLLRPRNHPYFQAVSSPESSTYCKYACGLGLAGQPASPRICARSRRSLV